MLLAACGKESLHAQLGREAPAARTDVEVLNRLLDLEHQAIAAYTAGAPLLAPAAAQAAKQFLAQELNHADGLGKLIKAAGGEPHKPPASYDLGSPHGSDDVLRLLHAIESAQLAAYLDAIPRLQPARVRTMAAAFFANDAQHISVVRSLLRESPVPAAFVTGRE
jgi:bacterioferritin (cytochrome b1)